MDMAVTTAERAEDVEASEDDETDSEDISEPPPNGKHGR